MENVLALLSLTAAALAAVVSGLHEAAGAHWPEVSVQRVLFGQHAGPAGVNRGEVWMRLQPHPALPSEPAAKRT